MENNKIINFNDLFIGMGVKDSEGNIGKIEEIENVHNVHVKFNNGGSGVYCLCENCTEIITVNGCNVEIAQYDPLYYL